MYFKYFAACFLIFFRLSCNCAFSQRIAVIADTQAPMRTETLWLKEERNTEATSVLFSHLLNEKVDGVLMLGDLVAMGSNGKDWANADYFIAALRRQSTNVYAIPGNHEYSFPASAGIAEFYKRFPRARETVQTYTINSVAMVLVDANYSHLSRSRQSGQETRSRHCLDSLQNDTAVRAIIVCTHQPPYTNSTAVKPSKDVQQRLVPVYVSTPKAVLFLSGHSHNMERFCEQGKAFLVAGGGGGLAQPLIDPQKQKYSDLIDNRQRIRFFYLIIERKGNTLTVKAKGMNTDDFEKMMETDILSILLFKSGEK